MNKTISILAILAVFTLGFFASPAKAQMGMMGFGNDDTVEESQEGHVESVETVLQSILKQHNVANVQELNLKQISDDEWARLGDAVMELQHPGDAHEAMDQMMGGEGSESLRQMHIAMGQAYLGYGTANGYGSGMMNYGNNRNFATRTGMMGYASPMGYTDIGGYGIFRLILWILAALFLASGSYFFVTQARKK